uniref:RING-type domain-containing protein n=1 Tax=Caenorhabditis japonica TaxID=281687 RepID=A0A8R1E3Z1_CAEJA
MHRNLAAKYLHLIGGCALSAEREPISEVERIHVQEVEKGHVRVIAENCGQLELARRSPACFLAQNGEILVAGGCLGPNDHTDSMEFLESIENLTAKKSSKILQEKMEVGASCSAFDPFSTSNFKPIFGGFEAHSCLDDVQVLDESAKWKCHKIPAKKLPKIKNAAVLEVKTGEFLMFGGWEDEQRTTKAIRRVIFNESFTDFTVNFEGFLPYPVEGHSWVQNGSDVYLIGGFDGFSVIDTIIRYNLDSKKTEIIPTKLAQKRENHVSAILSNKFLVVAGGWGSKNSLNDVEVFELHNGNCLERCQVEGNLNFARNRPAGVAIGRDTDA